MVRLYVQWHLCCHTGLLTPCSHSCRSVRGFTPALAAVLLDRGWAAVFGAVLGALAKEMGTVGMQGRPQGFPCVLWTPPHTHV